MEAQWRSIMRECLPALVAVALAVGGFGLMRLAAILESYLVLFASLAFMLAGVTMLLGNASGHGHVRHEWQWRRFLHRSRGD